MATFAWDIPGYIQGHRFSNEARYWDAVTGRFRDRAGYDHLGNYVELVGGTPAFSAHGANNRIGLLLDNSNTYKFHPSTPWEGSMLFVVKSHGRVGVPYQKGHHVILWSGGSAETTNGRAILYRNTDGSYRWIVTTATPSFGHTIEGLVHGVIEVVAVSFNQSDRNTRGTRDGITITETAADAGATGNLLAIGYQSVPGTIPDIGGISNDYARLGDLLGDGSLIADPDDYLHIFEQHFWKGDVLLNNPDELADFITSLKEYYGT